MERDRTRSARGERRDLFKHIALLPCGVLGRTGGGERIEIGGATKPLSLPARKAAWRRLRMGLLLGTLAGAWMGVRGYALPATGQPSPVQAPDVSAADGASVASVASVRESDAVLRRSGQIVITRAAHEPRTKDLSLMTISRGVRAASDAPANPWDLELRLADAGGAENEAVSARTEQSWSESKAEAEHVIRLDERRSRTGGERPPPTVLTFAIGGSLSPALEPSGQVLSFSTQDGARALTYGPPRAEDATGKEVSVLLLLDDRAGEDGARPAQARLIVEDGSAEFPVLVRIPLEAGPMRPRESSRLLSDPSVVLDSADRARGVESVPERSLETEGGKDAEAIPFAPPANDLCANAILIPGGALPVLTAPVDVIDATTTGDPASCVTEDRTIWYAFTAPFDGPFTFTSCPSAGALGTTLPDTVLGIYSAASGCGAIGAPIQCNDDDPLCTSGSPSHQSTITATLIAGASYYIVAGRYAGVGAPAPVAGQTSIQLRASVSAPPPNDACGGGVAGAQITLNIPVTGTTILAADDYELSTAPPTCYTLPSPPAPLGNGSASAAAGRDVVYQFHVPTTDKYSFRVTGYSSAQNPVLYLLSKCPASSGVVAGASCLAAANRNGSAGSEELMCVPLAAGQNVFVVVDDASATNSGSFFRVEATRCVREAEPNETPVAAGTASCGIEGSVNVTNDIDFYALGAPPAQSRLFAISDGIASSNGDQVMRVTTSADTLEFEDDDNDVPFNTLSPNVAGTPLPALAGYLRINPSSTTSAGIAEPYRLYSIIEPPIGSAAAEAEPNGTTASAASSGANYFAGTLAGPAPSTDVDIFRFHAAAGTLVTLGLDGDPLRDGTPINPALAMLDSAGSVLVSVNNAGSTSSTVSGAGSLTSTTPFSPAEGIVYRASTSGVYYARVSIGTSSAGSNGAGDYLLAIGLDCLPGDADADGVADGGDCAPANPSLWKAPGPAENLHLAGAGPTTLTWAPPALPGAGTGLRYDLLRSGSAADFSAANAICVESDGADTNSVDSGARPLAGSAYFYVVRVENGCGSTMGLRSSGTPRTGRTCP